jgi:hypothetical protein
MSPLNQNLETVDTEVGGPTSYVSEMRRVSMSLVYSPGRIRRRKHMNGLTGWFRSRFGIHRRRSAR